MRKISPLITLLIFSLLFSGCSDRRSYRRARYYMGTTMEFNITPSSKSIPDVEKVCDLAESKIAMLDEMLSIFNTSSEISRINDNAEKKAIKVPPQLFVLAKRAKEYFVLSGGAFDVTVEPLTEIWGFGPQKNKLPDSRTISEAVSHVGLDKIELDEQNRKLIFKDPGVRLDFGGFAKGYAVDEAVKIFKTHGITSGLLNLGGDLYCMGTRLDGKKWSVGIRDTLNKKGILAVLEISDKAIATSGSYENFYISHGKRYSHIIDPRSGRTVSNDIAGVTVIADDCTTADALATTVFVLGREKGLALIEKLAGVECVIVIERESKQNIIMSSGLGEYLKDDEA